jgi:membrane associated rhomboid family serine protease
MFVVLPFRSKNPPEHFPYATYTLIALCVLISFITADYSRSWLDLRDSVLYSCAVSQDHFTLFRLFASLFLHANLFHLLGNMLFLWIFGAASEGRLGVWKFLLVYFVSGMLGGAVECMTSTVYLIGASGAIMGVAGSYIYMFPHAPIQVFWALWLIVYFRARVSEWAAGWMILYYVTQDLILQLFSNGGDAVAHLVHLLGFGTGLLLAVLFGAKRDSSAVSEVQATRADLFNDISLMSYNELDVLVDAGTDNMALVIAYCGKAIARPGIDGEKKAIDTIERYKEKLLQYPDVQQVAELMLKFLPDAGAVSGPFYLKLGTKLETGKNASMALKVYRRVFELNPDGPDASAAVIRSARIYERILLIPDDARDAYQSYLDLFPQGVFAEEAAKGLERLGGRVIVNPIVRQTTIKKTVINDGDDFPLGPS